MVKFAKTSFIEKIGWIEQEKAKNDLHTSMNEPSFKKFKTWNLLKYVYKYFIKKSL